MTKLFGWTPPTRPSWVQHLNAMGEALGGPERLVSMDPDEMVESARASTGLSDFGADTWRQHYGTLVKSIREEARLHVAGRLLTRSEIMRSLRNRLFVEAYLAEHPDALAQPVEAPIVVCGYGRSGTSITHELLALDSAHRAPLAWELFNLSQLHDGAGGRREDRVRFAQGEQLYYEDVVPEFRTMHENGAELPVECLMFQMHEFLSAQYFGTLDVPGYMMHAMVAAGADIIELGVPFSDPMAEGPVIQLAHERALENNISLATALSMVGEFRQQNQATPVLLMGYANPIARMGYAEFANAAQAAGLDAVLNVDIPPEEVNSLNLELQRVELDNIFLVAPTTPAPTSRAPRATIRRSTAVRW